MAIAMSQMCKLKFMCCRQFQNRIEESVYSLLKIQIERFGLSDDFTILQNKITHKHTGSEFIFYGLARNFAEVKSTEGVDILWIEEAQFLTAEQWRDLDPTLRKEGAQVWLIFNPKYVTDFVWRHFVVNKTEDMVVRQINHNENPFLSDTSRKKIATMQRDNEEEYRHVYLGEPLEDSDRVIIKRSWIQAAIDAHKTLGISPTGQKRIGYDVADDGDDKNATVSAYGFLTMSVQEWPGQTDDLMGSCKRVHLQARQLQAGIFYDNIGVGAFAGSKFKELNQTTKARIQYKGFGAGAKKHKPDAEYQPGIKNKDFFSNLKAQAWWLVADRFRNTYDAIHHGQKFEEHELISISSDIALLERLIDELSTPRQDFDALGKVKVESKKDLAARDVESPNLADAFIMAYNPLIGTLVHYGKLL